MRANRVPWNRGDVVMIYAYRGVDLVVGVMGVLAAGAAFSVVGIFGLRSWIGFVMIGSVGWFFTGNFLFEFQLWNGLAMRLWGKRELVVAMYGMGKADGMDRLIRHIQMTGRLFISM